MKPRAGTSAWQADHVVVVAQSARMRAVLDFVRIVAASDSNVLITGATGTGKELIARLIHQSGPRRHRPFVPVSCALFAETLIESELFGHEQGAFTGAIRDRPGRFELAQDGTVFLDDMDDVPLALQAKLLRVLQNRTVERVGSHRAIPVHARVIAGAKRDLRGMVVAGTFREDLYFRLNVLPIRLAPLRERRDDIPPLTDFFLERAFRARGDPPKPLSPAVRQAFQTYAWPGNVRELENACERIAQVCTCEMVRVGCLPVGLILQPVPAADGTTPAEALPPTPVSLDDRLREVEANLIRWALRVTGGNRSRAAELLHVKRSTLIDRIHRLGLAARESKG